jgi:hypothetical protein
MRGAYRSGGNGGFALAPRDDLDSAMIQLWACYCFFDEFEIF